MKKENKQAIIAEVIMLSIIAVLVGIFCAVWFTVPINVLDRIEDVCNSGETLKMFYVGKNYEIPSAKALEIIKDELKDIKFVNAPIDTKNYNSLTLQNEAKYISFAYNTIYVNKLDYLGKNLNCENLKKRLVAEGIFIPDPNDPEYQAEGTATVFK